MRTLSILLVSALCSVAASQAPARQDPVRQDLVRQDLVTRAFRIAHCEQAIQKGTAGQILRRLLTPKLGSVEYFPKTQTLVVKDTAVVVDSFAALVCHFDRAPQQDLVTHSFGIRYCGYQLTGVKPTLMESLRRVSTPGIGRIAYDPKTRSLVVADTQEIVAEIASILKQVDVEPQQVFFNIQFVTTRDANLWKGRVAPAAGAVTRGIGTLTAKEAKGLMREFRQDAKTQIVQAPKIIALDHQQASIFIGDKSPSSRSPSYQASLVPHTLPRSNKVIVDIKRGKADAQVLVRSGNTIVYREVDADQREVLVFVTPRRIDPPAVSAKRP